jgi:Domain of unknown function (DUF4398)
MTSLSIGKYLIAPFVAAVIGAGGCSSVAPPTGTVSQAQLAIREAEQNKAAQHAPLELRKARVKFNDAEKAMRDEEYLKARRLSEQALVDARLAEVKAESEIARQNAADLKKAIDSLRAEAERGSSK